MPLLPMTMKCYDRNICVTYPDILKTAGVVTIFKEGNKDNVSNYRPISTLSIFNKIIVQILHVRLVSFF